MRKFLILLVLAVPLMVFAQGGTTSSDILPANTGQNLGSPTQQWDLFSQDIDVYRNFRLDNPPGLKFCQFAVNFFTSVITAKREDGTTPCTFAAAGGGGSGMVVHNLLGTWHDDTVPGSSLAGSLIVGNTGSTSLWQAFLGNTTTTPLCFQETGNGSAVTSFGWAACAPMIQHNTVDVAIEPRLNFSDTPTTGTPVIFEVTDTAGVRNTVAGHVTIPAAAPQTPPAPFAIPTGQGVAWAFPDTCTTQASDDGTTYYSWTNDGRASYQCGSTGGILSRYISSPLGIPFYRIRWTGFTMPTLPGDAVIQHIYPVFIGVRPNVFGGDEVACGSGATEDSLFSSVSATYGGYLSSSTSLGSTSSVVTNAYCQVINGISLSATGLDTQTVQLFALAIYYTSATPIQTDSSSFFAFPFYSAINGVSPVFTSVADGTPIVYDASYNFITNKYTTLNHTTPTRALNVSNMQNGGNYVMEFIQDSTGGAAVTAGAGCTWVNPDGSTFSPSIGTGASAHSFIQWHYDGTRCLVTGTGSGSGGGNTTSTSLTTNTLPKANGANSIVDSKLSDDGTKLSYAGTGGMEFPGAFLDQGTKQAGTSVTLDSGMDFASFVGSDNQLHCQLSVALGGGSCLPSGITHTITIPIAGAPIATGQGNVGPPGITSFSCTITAAKILSPTSGSITVEIWKAAGAIPTSGNKISASAPVTLSSAAVNTSSSLTGWTTSVSSNDVFWASVATTDGVLTNATVVLVCQ